MAGLGSFIKTPLFKAVRWNTEVAALLVLRLVLFAALFFAAVVLASTGWHVGTVLAGRML